MVTLVTAETLRSRSGAGRGQLSVARRSRYWEELKMSARRRARARVATRGSWMDARPSESGPPSCRWTRWTSIPRQRLRVPPR